MIDREGRVAGLGEKILQLLGQGLEVPPDVLFFAESTYGLEPSGLEEALNDPEFEGREALRALLLTPGRGLRLALEPLLEDFACSGPEMRRLAADLQRRLGPLLLLLPDTRSIALATEPADLDFLVAKLYLDRRFDPEIGAALNQCVGREIALEARLLMRCRGDVLSGTKQLFLGRIIDGSRDFGDRFLDLFGLALCLLGEAGDHDNLENHFLAHRRQLLRTLNEIKAFEDNLRRYSMEYLMLQRYPIPCQNEEGVLARLLLLTTITDVVLGLPPDPSTRIDYHHLGTHYREAGIEAIIRVLS